MHTVQQQFHYSPTANVGAVVRYHRKTFEKFMSELIRIMSHGEPTRYYDHLDDAPPGRLINTMIDLQFDISLTSGIDLRGGICCRLGKTGGFFTCTRKYMTRRTYPYDERVPLYGEFICLIEVSDIERV